ncbi:MAG: TonB-dependent receptor [Bacteroidota bacterium]
MKKLLTAIIFLTASTWATAQEKKVFTPDGDSASLPDVLISAIKFPEKKKNIVQKIDVITDAYIKKANAQNTGDLLQSTGNVFVQKSQQGGSSPVIRGFEASRILMVVDGVRMNNAVYRAGHLQNVITVDQNMLERVEVMYGPSSTLHGSDALGGVIAFKTKSPMLSGAKNKLLYTGSAMGRYSTVNLEKTGHVDMSLGGQKLAVLVSGTFSDFGDMRMGNNYPDKYPNFGRRPQYVGTVNNIDYILDTKDDRIQKYSGYKQWDIMGKLLFQQSDKISHMLNVQSSNSTDVPRYDRLQDIRNGALRYANWYYGPQKRNLYSYEFVDNINSTTFVKVGASYQDIEESRHQRDRNNPSQLHRIEKIKVWGAHADLRKIFGMHELNVGVDMQLNDVKSTAFTENINTGAIGKLDTRYPDGKNTFNNFGIYAQHLWKLHGGKLVINDGIRVQSVSLRSTLVDTSIQFKLPFLEIKQNPVGVSGNLGAAYMPQSDIRFTAGVTTGFRAPNIDDVVKIFESNTASRQLVVPNADLKPEKTINAEIGFTKSFEGKVKVDVSAFYTWFKDAIAYAAFKYNGQDSVIYQGVKVGVKASQNVAKARLYGFSGGLTFTPVTELNVYGSVTYTYGQYTKPTGVKVPLDHVPPVFGKAGISYNKKKFLTEIFAMYNGWKKIADYNPDGEDNQQYATPDGVPSWVTLNWRGQYDATKNLTVQLAVENITDRNYRVFASGFSAPGLNFLLSAKVTW